MFSHHTVGKCNVYSRCKADTRVEGVYKFLLRTSARYLFHLVSGIGVNWNAAVCHKAIIYDGPDNFSGNYYYFHIDELCTRRPCYHSG